MARILVICGGDNLERRVSLASGDAVALGLSRAGHQVMKLDTAFPDRIVPPDEPLLHGPVGPAPPDELSPVRMDRNRWAKLTATLASGDYDAVFPILHGTWGEDGGIQALLELLNYPFLGSGVLSSRICMNKVRTKEIAARAGVPAPEGFIVSPGDSEQEIIHGCEGLPGGFPAEAVVLKPAGGGSAVDVFIINDPLRIPEVVETIRSHGDIPLVEQFISGRELTVTILGDRALPVIEIAPEGDFYDYTHKYTKGRTRYLCPAPLDESIAEKVRKMSLDVFRVLECRHVARIDWRLRDDGALFFLEVNTIPGMTDLSLVPMAAQAVGLSFDELMDEFVRMILDGTSE